MGSFDGSNWKIYLSEEARDRRDEILNHLKENYQGPSHFVREKLREENALSVEEQIDRKKSKREEIDQDLKRLKQIKREREQQSMLRDKKQLLKEKQSKLRDLSDKHGLSREKALEMAESRELQQRKPSGVEESDYLDSERVQDRIQQRADKILDKAEGLDELVAEVERLQKEVKELNGGRENWFMDLSQRKVRE